jgi:hypothetical protein
MGESGVHRETQRALDLAIPIVATPFGYLLFQAGCNAGFKNWYFSEGGWEGPPKLQGFKALDEEHSRNMIQEIIKEVEQFLNRKLGVHWELEQQARDRARTVLGILGR